jgi:hypothetical protein
MSVPELNSINRTKAVPTISDQPGPELITAMKELKPLLDKAKQSLSRIPLREVIDPKTGERQLLRIATAEELQRILMQSCLGRVVVDTVPTQIGTNPGVTAQICILTTKGYVKMPGASASERAGEFFSGEPILSAESRAIRRALREIGLRAESEVFDSEDADIQSKIEMESKSIENQVTVDEGEVANDENNKAKNKRPDSQSEDAGIPDMPENFKSASKGAANRKSAVKPKATARKVTLKNEAVAGKEELIAPTQGIVEPDYGHKEWPNRSLSSYCGKLHNSLSKKQKSMNVNMKPFITNVLGEAEGSRTLRSCLTDELEKLYQFYIIQDSKNTQE